jgi:Concanavalin A-like lectin/glucanases superfamily
VGRSVAILIAVATLSAGCADLAGLDIYAQGSDGSSNTAGAPGTGGAGASTGSGGSTGPSTGGGGGAGGTGGSGGGGAVTLAQAYANAVMADNPIAYWRLDEPAGSRTALDSTGNGYNAVFESQLMVGVPGLLDGGLAVLVPDISMSDIHLVGPVDLANIGTGGAHFSLEAWIRPNSTMGGTRGIFDDHVSLAGGVNWAINASGFLTLRFNENAFGESFVATGVELSPGTAYHIVATFDGTVRQYVNAVSAGFTVPTLAITSNVPPVILGSTGGPGLSSNAFDGVIDDFAIYATALMPARITAHYVAGTQPAN